jgi:predicted TIM-barrel fold metal-dependent hydrolase
MIDPKDMSVAALRTLDVKGVRSVRVHVGKVVADYGATIENVERVLGMTSQSIHEAGLRWPVDAQLSLSTWAKLAGVLEDLHEQYGTIFVADHMFCADPSAAGSPELERVLELVEKGIVYVKICGMAKYAPDGLEDLRPVIQAVLRCSSGSMAIWGSDWPHANLHGKTTKVDVQQQLVFLHGICKEEGEGHWEKLTRDNAAKLYT